MWWGGESFEKMFMFKAPPGIKAKHGVRVEGVCTFKDEYTLIHPAL